MFLMCLLNIRFEPKSSSGGHSSGSDHDEDGDELSLSTAEKKINEVSDVPKSKLLRSKRSNFAHKNDRKSIGTQTLEQLPQTYQQIFVDLLEMGESNKISDESIGAVSSNTATSAPLPPANDLLASFANPTRSTPLSPHSILDQYTETTTKKRDPSSHEPINQRVEMYRDQIQMLNQQLQFERYRREVHAERNRRLLGKSRVNAALEMDNEKLREQKDQLVHDVEALTLLLNKARMSRTQQEQDFDRECSRYQREIQSERDEKKALKENIEAMQRNLLTEQKLKKDLMSELEAVRAEMFDMRNELMQTQERAEMGLHYKNELVRLQSEVVLMGEIQMKCKDKLSELDGLKARDEEAENMRTAYAEEVKGEH